MASTQAWYEFNGTISTTSPGNTEASLAWKATDDSSASNYTANVLVAPTITATTAPTYSFEKMQALRFSGTWNNLSAFSYSIFPAPIQDNAGITSYLRLFWNTQTASASFSLNSTSTWNASTPVGPTVSSTTGGNFVSTVSAGSTGWAVTGVSFIGPSNQSPFTASTGVTSTSANSTGASSVYAQAFRSQLQVLSSLVTAGELTTTTVVAAWTES